MLSNLSEMDIKLLRVFATVADAGGFSAAQIELNVGPSTISTHMKALEQRLGVRLCERGRSGFRLTERGTLIYQASQRLFLALDEFRTEAGAARNCLTGSVTVGIIDWLVSNPDCALDRAIGAFNKVAPEVQISVRVVSPSELERLVLDGTCDFGLGACGQHSPYLYYEDAFAERQVLYCGAGHPLFLASLEFEVSELHDYQFVLRAYAAPDSLPSSLRPAATAVADLMDGVAALILSGRYLGFLPEHMADFWVSQDRMRPILDSSLGYLNAIYLTTRKADATKPATELFLKEFRRAQGIKLRKAHATKGLAGGR
jgi:DNA-binding transcriptional LysR family regulator